MLHIGTEEYKRAVRIDQLKREGRIEEMIANILAAQRMTPDELVACLVSGPYNLAPSEENLREILRIVNDHERLLKVNFEKNPENTLGIKVLLGI